jgi:hypothetical protein
MTWHWCRILVCAPCWPLWKGPLPHDPRINLEGPEGFHPTGGADWACSARNTWRRGERFFYIFYISEERSVVRYKRVHYYYYYSYKYKYKHKYYSVECAGTRRSGGYEIQFVFRDESRKLPRIRQYALAVSTVIWAPPFVTCCWRFRRLSILSVAGFFLRWYASWCFWYFQLHDRIPSWAQQHSYAPM